MDKLYNYREIKWAISREAELVHPVIIKKTGEFFTIHDLFTNEKFYTHHYHEVNPKLKNAYGVNYLMIIGTDEYYMHKLKSKKNLSSAFSPLPEYNDPTFFDSYHISKNSIKVDVNDLITFARQIKILERLEEESTPVEELY